MNDQIMTNDDVKNLLYFMAIIGGITAIVYYCVIMCSSEWGDFQSWSIVLLGSLMGYLGLEVNNFE